MYTLKIRTTGQTIQNASHNRLYNLAETLCKQAYANGEHFDAVIYNPDNQMVSFWAI